MSYPESYLITSLSRAYGTEVAKGLSIMDIKIISMRKMVIGNKILAINKERECSMLKSSRLILIAAYGKLVTQFEHATQIILETSLTSCHQFNNQPPPTGPPILPHTFS